MVKLEYEKGVTIDATDEMIDHLQAYAKSVLEQMQIADTGNEECWTGCTIEFAGVTPKFTWSSIDEMYAADPIRVEVPRKPIDASDWKGVTGEEILEALSKGRAIIEKGQNWQDISTPIGDADHDSIDVMRPCADCSWMVARIERHETGRWTMTCDECGTCATGDDLLDVMETWNDGPSIRVLGGMVRENPDG